MQSGEGIETYVLAKNDMCTINLKRRSCYKDSQGHALFYDHHLDLRFEEIPTIQLIKVPLVLP